MYQQVYTNVNSSRLLSGVLRRTFQTLKLVPEKSRAALFSSDPRTVCPRGIMANMLRVSAFQFGDPVTLFVLAETYDSSFHKNHYTS
jgi:hypothetical protein